MKLSIVIPVYNERESIRFLHIHIKSVLDKNKDIVEEYEIIFVDDGSTDGTYEEIKSLNAENVRPVFLHKNHGKTAALNAGFRKAAYEAIMTMDGDLQDDSNYIPLFLRKLQEGYDCVCGWRVNDRNGFFRRLISRIANSIKNIVLKESFHDPVSPFRVFKKEVISEIHFKKSYHRFFNTLLTMKGARIVEIPVERLPRLYGKSKFNFKDRLLEGLKTLLEIKRLKSKMHS